MTSPVEAFAWDASVFHALNRDFGPAVDAAVRFFNSRASTVVGALALLAWAFWKWRARSAPLLLAALLAVVATDVVGARLLKPGFARTRPCYALPAGSFRQVVPVANVGSLPSLHAANWFAAVTPLSLAAPPAAPLLFALATAVALSRVVAGVHWPSDVLLGSLLGVAMGLLATFAVRALARRWRGRADGLRTRAPEPP